MMKKILLIFPLFVFFCGPVLAQTVTLSPCTHTFNNSNIGTPSTDSPLACTLTNNSSTAINILSISFTGSNPGDFSDASPTTTCGSSLGVGNNCSIFVSFVPTTSGVRNSSLTVTYQNAGLGTGTFSLAQPVASCVGVSGAGTCVATLTQPMVAGNLDVFSCSISDNSPGFIGGPQILSVSAGGILNHTFAASTAIAGGAGWVGQFKSSAFILPSNSTGTGTNTVTITYTEGSGGSCYIAELKPSANSANVGLDIDSNYLPIAACTTCTNLTVSLSGTNDAVFQDEQGQSSFQAPSAVTAPYNANLLLGSEAGFSIAPTPANGAGASWTTNSTIPVMGTLAFGWNVTPCLEQSLNQFSGGAGLIGSAPTQASLSGVSNQLGFQGGVWETGNASQMIYSSSGGMGLRTNTGRLCDGSSAAAGSGSGMSLQITGTGTAVIDYIQYNLLYGAYSPNLVMAIKYNDTYSASDSSENDCFGVRGQTGFAGTNCYGASDTRYFRVETPVGNGNNVSFPGGSTAGNCPCTIEVEYEGAGNITANNVSATTTGGTTTFTGAFTATKWPVGLAFSPIAGGTGVSASVSGSTATFTGTFPNVFTVGSTFTLEASGSCNGTGFTGIIYTVATASSTVVTAPANGATGTTPTGCVLQGSECTGGSGYNAGLFYVSSASNSAIVATQLTNSSPTGSTSGCVLTPTEVVSFWNSTGVPGTATGLIGQSFHFAYPEQDNPEAINIGWPSAMFVTSGVVIHWSNFQVALGTQYPISF
jgi:hypothetical protein